MHSGALLGNVECPSTLAPNSNPIRICSYHVKCGNLAGLCAEENQSELFQVSNGDFLRKILVWAPWKLH